MSYTQLPMVEVNIDDLLLDLENYRIPTVSPDEATALRYMFASEDVLGAAKLILRDGYFDNEVPIAVLSATDPMGKRQYVVLEGNRRVSALKVLGNPKLVPGHEKEVRQLLKRYAVEASNLPTRIRVLVAPDRAVAAPHIARLHTGLSKRSWSRDQQATFYYSLVDDENTVEDVNAQYPDVDVVRFIRMAAMRRFLTAVPFKDRTLRQFVAGDQLRMSVFEYAYRNKAIADAIGVKFNPDGTLVPKTAAPEKIGASLSGPYLAALETLLSGFRGPDGLNTRSPEFKKTTTQHEELIARLAGRTGQSISPSNPLPPSPTTLEPLRGTDTEQQQNSASGDSGTPATVSSPRRGPGARGPNHPDTKNKLELAGVDYQNAPINLQSRYFELRKIDLGATPSAAALLLRSVLETTIKTHFASAGTPVSGELSAVFGDVAKKFGSLRVLRNTINTIKSGVAQKPGSIQWFNLVAHSADTHVTKADVQLAWKVVSPLLQHLLRTSGATDRSSD